jgi:hypothetical protein
MFCDEDVNRSSGGDVAKCWHEGSKVVMRGGVEGIAVGATSFANEALWL